MRLEATEDHVAGLYSDDAVYLAAVFKDQKGRNALNAEACRCSRVRIDVEFAHEHVSREFGGENLDCRSDHHSRRIRRPSDEEDGARNGDVSVAEPRGRHSAVPHGGRRQAVFGIELKGIGRDIRGLPVGVARYQKSHECLDVPLLAGACLP